jgi:hypothetical protein
MLALCGVAPGAIMRKTIRNVFFPFDPTLSGYARSSAQGNDPMLWIGMAIGSCVVLAVVAIWGPPSKETAESSDRVT